MDGKGHHTDDRCPAAIHRKVVRRVARPPVRFGSIEPGEGVDGEPDQRDPDNYKGDVKEIGKKGLCVHDRSL